MSTRMMADPAKAADTLAKAAERMRSQASAQTLSSHQMSAQEAEDARLDELADLYALEDEMAEAEANAAAQTPSASQMSTQQAEDDDLDELDRYLNEEAEAERAKEQARKAQEEAEFEAKLRQATEAASKGLLSIRSANDCITDSAVEPEPDNLWRGIWMENEVCCLFADSNAGKSILAVQIADEVAQRRPVVYFDFELSDKQFQRRYWDIMEGKRHWFPRGFYRGELNAEYLSTMRGTVEADAPLESIIVDEIYREATMLESTTVIIDNLSFLCAQAEQGEFATQLMMRLLALKKKGFSILVLAHTPKRQLNLPLSQNDLAGSKRLMNFMDAAFAIGRSVADDNIRYIKQVKSRSSEIVYDSDNVLVGEIVRNEDDAFLRFEFTGTECEKMHLRSNNKLENRAELIEKATALRADGLVLKDIAAKLNLSLSKVYRLLNA